MDATYERPLGQLETQMALMHEQGGTTQTCSALRLSGELDSGHLRAAAQALNARHALLRCRIRDDGQQLSFCADRPLDDAPVQVLPLGERFNLGRLLEHELAQPLAPEISLWRLVVLSDDRRHEHCLLLTCHHAIADAVTLPQLLSELLQLCAIEATEQRQAVGSVLPPPLEQQQERQLHVAPTAPAATAPPHEQLAPLDQRSTRVVRRIVPASVLQRLLLQARQLGLSLNSLLAAALLKAAHEEGLGQRIGLASAINLRQRIARPFDDRRLGCYIGVARTELQVQERSLREIAADYQRQLHALLPTQALYQERSGSLTERRDQVRQLTSSPCFTQGVALTNHGVIRIAGPEGLVLRDYANVASRLAGNFAVAVHATTFQGSLSLCFTFVEPLISTARIERLQQRLYQALLAITPSREIPA